ncbi:hypothetical protein [Streptomyces sp. NPDC050263]|uniref:hypothetical protein n=1 Tax=Streptomyces sp. NPDC050263 TaxID=3155037 RepID=UPI003427C329
MLQRLDRTAADLTQTAAEDAQGVLEQLRAEESGSWTTRFRDLLQDLPEAERDEAAEELRSLVEHVQQHGSHSGASAGAGGVAVVGGDVTVRATRGSMAAVTVNGGMHMDPPQPGPAQD